MTIQVILELTAGDQGAERLTHWLRSVLPGTRGADGCAHLQVVQSLDDPHRVIIIETWDSREQYETYMAWREGRGDTKTFASYLAHDPVVTFARFVGI